MNEREIARGLWQQVKTIVEFNGFLHVNRLELLLGSLHKVSADGLRDQLSKALEGDAFEDCRVEVRTVEPGQSYAPPGRRESAVASGWELLITRIDGIRNQEQ